MSEPPSKFVLRRAKQLLDEQMPGRIVSPAITEAMLRRVVTEMPPGDFVEVGVYQGGTAVPMAALAREMGRGCWFFDTFKGIPYRRSDMDSHVVGDFAADYLTVAERIWRENPAAHVVQGVFPASAPDGDNLRGIGFVHLDVDQYWSYKDAIAWLRPRMAHGGLMFFDDVGCLRGATVAVEEEFRDRLIRPDEGKPFVRF